MVVKLTAALKYEEMDSGWLSAEAAELVKAREHAKDHSKRSRQRVSELKYLFRRRAIE